MLQVLLSAGVTGGALVVGAALGCFRTPPKQLTAGMLAFTASALVVAVTFVARHAGCFRSRRGARLAR
jgi:hypothetical protein